NVEPVPTCVPPVAASYHFSVPPAHPDAVSITVPGPHRDTPLAVGAVGMGLTVITTVDVTAGQGPAGSLVVNVSVTVPLAIAGVYVDVKELGSEKLPPGADHVPLVAPRPTLPANVTVPPAHTDCGDPALAVATGLIVIVTVDVAAGQGPEGSFVVNVNVTEPAAISAAVGV